MPVDLCLHSVSTALHYYLGSGSAAPVPVTHVNRSRSVLAPASGSATGGP